MIIRRLHGKLFKKIFGSFGLKIAYTILNFVISVILARVYGKEGLGIFSLATTWAYVLTIPFSLGLTQLSIRETSIYQSSGSFNLLRGFLLWSNKVILLVSILGISILNIVAYYFFLSPSNHDVIIAFSIISLTVPLGAMRNLRTGILKGYRSIFKSLSPEFLFLPIFHLIFISAGFKIFENSFDINYVLWAKVLSTFLSFSLGSYWLIKAIPGDVKNAPPKYNIRVWIKQALPFIFVEASLIINSRIDVLMLGAMINPEEVGVYSVVLKVTQLVVFILGAVNSVISPEISSLYNIGDKEKLQNIIKKSSQIIIISSSVISLIICIFAPQILSIFGNGFTVGTNAMLITCAGQMINAATGSVGILLSMTGNQKIAAINVFFSAIINIFLNLVLIPRYGINGAAFATFVSTVISNLLNLYWVLKKIKINPTIFSFNPYKNRAN